jgi:hypothetical protein
VVTISAAAPAAKAAALARTAARYGTAVRVQRAGFQSFVQPVTEALAAYGVSLI